MNPITKIDNLLNPIQARNNPADQTLRFLEGFIDKLVTAVNRKNKQAAQDAVKKQQMLEEFEKKVAYLKSQLLSAERALAAMEQSLRPAATTPVDNLRVNEKKAEVLYWQTRLQQVDQPGGSTPGL